jgi:hypothetical protein
MTVRMMRRGMSMAAVAVASAVASAVGFAGTLSAQASPAPTAVSTTFTPAQVKAATSDLDAHVSAHPKQKAAAVSAIKSSSALRDASGARALRTPVPKVKPAAGGKKR